MSIQRFHEWTRRVVSKAQQVGLGEPFQTDEMGRPDPNPQVQLEAQAYCRHYSLPSVDHTKYIDVDQERAGRIADAYEAMPMDDSDNPLVAASYTALAREVVQQWQWAVSHGMQFEPWLGQGDAYAGGGGDSEVWEPDADMFHRHLYFYTGGDPNRFMRVKDATTGYTVNDMFRAVHDYYGHAAMGADFGPRGEENAWVSHMQMFSAAASRALTTETRGQNSWVNFGRQNYDGRGNYKFLPPWQRPYAVQKTAVFSGENDWINHLPPEWYR